MNLDKVFENKVYAGVLGKIIGVYLGRPFEGWSYDRIMEELGPINYYVNDKLDFPIHVTDDDLSGTSVVEVDQLQRSGETGVLQGLSGKASGVQITRNSGDPGSGAYIQIRGQNTINGDNSPLIVLDGAPISNANIGGNTAGVVQQSRLNDINPEDIESVSVIKGAAAAALYGTGAANGVLVINTKRGSKESKGWSFNVKTSLSVDRVNREWGKQDTWGQGYDGIWYDGMMVTVV